MHTRGCAISAKAQDGTVLIEALVAVLLFSLGILALVGLQASMSRNVTQAKLRAEAAFLANQLIGQMWVDQANLSSYAAAAGACSATAFTNCINWQGQVGRILPDGRGDVTINGPAVNILLRWQMPGEAPSQFQIDANIVN